MFRVSLYSCPAILPFSFAIHPWLIVETPEGSSRWEVGWNTDEGGKQWGHLYQDDLPLTSGIRMFPFTRFPQWKGKCIGTVEGVTAERMAAFIQNSPQTYEWKNTYRLVGPNSNSYVKWVVKNFPESGLRMPWNAFG